MELSFGGTGRNPEGPSGSQAGRAGWVIRGSLLSVALVLIALAECPEILFGRAFATGNYYRNASNRHSSTGTGVLRDGTLPRGSCNQCHTTHAANDFALFAADDNNLCYTCHNGTFGWERSWAGSAGYNAAAHGGSTALYDPANGAGVGRQVRLCVQCHNPHGNGDATDGFYASLTGRLEQSNCFSNNTAGTAGTGCHGQIAGYRPTNAVNVYTAFTRTYTHTLTLGDGSPTRRHSSLESQATNSGALSGANRHVECADCHNPHLLRRGNHASPGNAPGVVLWGAWGVQPTFGAAWIVPTVFTVRTFSGAGGERESWLCYKCHSYFAYGNTPPVGQTDVAREFNTANLSYHPVEGTILQNSYTITTATNGNIETMEIPWQTGGVHKTMTCTDCHRSDQAGDAVGPHGSNTASILRAAVGTTYATLSNALCVVCHKLSVYNPAADPTTTETGSRFDRQTTADSTANHYAHVSGGRALCRDCHASDTALNDGGNDNPSAGTTHGTNVVIGFLNGVNIQTFAWPNAAAGSCDPNCHANKTLPASPR